MKALWVTPDGVVSYSSIEHLNLVRKFLFWGQGDNGESLLIAGGESYSPFRYTHEGLLQLAQQHDPTLQTVGKPDGAGNCRRGIVLKWGSVMFRLETPKDLRTTIAEILGAQQ